MEISSRGGGSCLAGKVRLGLTVGGGRQAKFETPKDIKGYYITYYQIASSPELLQSKGLDLRNNWQTS